MYMLRKLLIALPVVLLLGFSGSRPPRPVADIALVIDLSGSTNGLLDDVRDNLWVFSNSFRRAYPEHELRLGVVGYSRGSFGMENAYVKVLSDLTTHFDLVSYRLFDLVANVEKGDQYVGAAIKTAVSGLSWTDGPSKKAMLLFGNSSPALGAFDYNKAVEWAAEKNIVIHSIYCSRGNDNPNYLAQWNGIAGRTGGNMYKMAVTRRSPNTLRSQPTEDLLALNNKLNETYIPYTREGQVHYNLLLAADVNSLQMSEQFFYARCYYKLSATYQEHLASFDLAGQVEKTGVLPPLNRRYLPDDLANTPDAGLLEIALLRAARRAGLLSRMRESIRPSFIDSLAVNPIDSIFMETMRRKKQ
jgi:hypothetical protein